MNDDYLLIERILDALEGHPQEQPDMLQLAVKLGVREVDIAQVFERWAGAKPKGFFDSVSQENLKRHLLKSFCPDEIAPQAGSKDVLLAYDPMIDLAVIPSGGSSDRATIPTTEAVDQAAWIPSGGSGDQAADISIAYGFHRTPFGECLLALAGGRVCRLAFVQDGGRAAALDDLHQQWRGAEFHEDGGFISAKLGELFSASGSGFVPIPLLLKGTVFQLKVWYALLHIPPRSLVCYEQVAGYIGRPTASRAVGNAVGDNPIAYLAPCHRVIRKSGVLGNYRYGPARKIAMLGWEFTR